MNEALVWLAVVACITQSAMFSGLNLAVFGVSRLRIEVEASTGNAEAQRLLGLRGDANFLLTTILWGNVSVNCLLTILSDSVLTGVGAFFFSTVTITFAGEIIPQAYFSRHALAMVSLLAPVLRFYQIILYPVAKPSAIMLNWWLGHEGIQFFREKDMREVIRVHAESEESDVDTIEGIGAINFLGLDDIRVTDEGEAVDPRSVIALPVERGRTVFPNIERVPSDPFLKKIERSGKKWAIITDPSGAPELVVNTDELLRAALFHNGPFQPLSYCHRPILVRDPDTRIGKVLWRLRVEPERPGDDVIDDDLILIWGEQKRVITGADILGRLLRGIATRSPQ